MAKIKEKINTFRFFFINTTKYISMIRMDVIEHIEYIEYIELSACNRIYGRLD